MPATTMQVQLLTMTPDAEALVYSAAKQCTSSDDAADVFEWATTHEDCAMLGMEYVSDEDQHKLIRRVINSGHTSILECVSFSFAISGISRACSHQLVRHRVGCSYAQQSQRYVKADDFEYVVPPSVTNCKVYMDNAGAVWDEAMHHARIAYEALIARGIQPEDARFVLPNACATKIVVTMNCRALLHFFEERCCNRSQWEIRAMAKAMLAICKDKLPVVFATAGPKCTRLGRCPEAKPCAPHLEQMAKDGGRRDG